jgi:signal transduction histidine kinase
MTKAMESSNRGTQICAVDKGFSPIMGQAKVRDGSVVVLKNIACRKQESERSQRKDRLTAMGEMAAKIAHEIRNPLGSIELFATGLRASLEDQPDLQLLAERISSGVKSIDAIISNLLQFVRPDEANRFERFDIYEALDDSLFFMKHLADRENGVDVKLEYGPRPLFINGDVELIKQVCLNIILNAIQSMPGGGVLNISTAQRPMTNAGRSALAEIRISDNGVGIDPDHVSRIFDPFFTTKERGTGLGLSIVHSIVEMHGGIIDVSSTPGDGTMFAIGLPLIADASAAQEAVNAPVLEKEVPA